MNNVRREKIKREEYRIFNVIKTQQFDKETLKQIRNNISDILDEESWAFDNYPENLQNSSRGEAMQDAIDCLSTSIECIESIIDELNIQDNEDIIDILEEACDELMDARLV
jgi:hypothetical protein